MADKGEDTGRDDVDDDVDDVGDGDGSEDDGKGTRPDRRFTQSELDRISQRAATKAARKARQDLADTWGVPLDEVEAILRDRKERADAETTETERARARAVEAEQAAVAREQKARTSSARSELKAALADPDDDGPAVRRGRADAILKLYLDDVLNVDDDDLPEAITDVIERARKEYPEFFGPGQEADDETGGGGGSPPGPRRKISERAPGSNPGAKSEAQRRFDERKSRERPMVLPRNT